MTETNDLKRPCYCLSGQIFAECCWPLISLKKLPENALQLMRSRYSAFNVGEVDYLIATCWPDNRQDDDSSQIQETIENTEWLGLKIIKYQPPSQNDRTSWVEFIAYFLNPDQSIGQLHENSRFLKQEAQWYYVDGEQKNPIKISRNDLCVCGNEKKYKKCHGKGK